MGEQMFADGIDIIDDPLRKRGLRSRPFDGEGVAGAALALVEDGVLKTWLLDCATARELGLATTGHAQRGVSSTPSPGADQPASGSRARVTPEELIADIEDGFYVTDLIGMGVNMVTGDYSRGASGFWIENGERTYPVSEVTIAGHLLDMFRIAHAGQRSRIPLRHQRADPAAGGPDRCRPVSLRRLRARSPRSMREAGAIARATARGAVQALDQGQGPFAGQRGRHRGQRFPARAAAGAGARGRLAVGGNRGRSGARAARRRLGRRSDRRHARLSRRPRRTGSISVALVDDGRPVLAALYAPVTDEMFLATAGGKARRATARRSTSAPATVLPARGWPGPNASSNASQAGDPTWCRSRKYSFAGAAARPRRAWRNSTPPSPAQGSHDWDLAAADLLVHEAGGVH